MIYCKKINKLNFMKTSWGTKVCERCEESVSEVCDTCYCCSACCACW